MDNEYKDKNDDRTYQEKEKDLIERLREYSKEKKEIWSGDRF